MYELEVFRLFILAFMRVTGLVVSAPILGSRNFPATAKIGLAGLVAILLTPVLPAREATLPADLTSILAMGVSELAIGMIMGFVMTLSLASIQVAGQIVDMLSGFGLVNVFNPAMETQVPVFGFFYFILALLYMFVLNGHHMMLKYLAISFQRVPVGEVVLHPEIMGQASVWGRIMFTDALLIAAPVAVALFLAYVSMGLMGRVVPQIQLFVVGFPITIALALLMTAFFIELYMGITRGLFAHMWTNVETIIRGFAPSGA